MSWDPVPQVCGHGWQVEGAEFGRLDAGGDAHSAGWFVMVKLRVFFNQIYHFLHLFNDVLRGLSITNIVDGTDQNDLKSVRFVAQVHPVQHSGHVPHPAAHHCLHLKVVVSSKVGVLPDVEQGATGEQHPPSHVGGQLCRLILLADRAGEGAQSAILEGELPNLLGAEVVVVHLGLPGATEGAGLVPVLALFLLLSDPGYVPGPDHFGVDQGDWLACWPVGWRGPGNS